VKKRDRAGKSVASTLADFAPESDPALPIVAAILRIVPASRWAFSRLEVNGELGRAIGSEDGPPPEFEDEFARERTKAKTGPRIAPLLGPLGEFQSGVTLLFADACANFGILTLLRTSELGPFTSSEISVLTLALDSTSESLSALRLGAFEASTSDVGHASEVAGGPFYVLDRDLHIVLSRTEQEQRCAATPPLRTSLPNRLPAVLEETVRNLTSGWSDHAPSQESGVAHPAPFLVVRTHPMSGSAGFFIGVHVNRSAPKSLVAPTARFHFTPRELQVLALLLEGAKLEEIGRQLYITSSTVQDHVKSMVVKTGSRNRTELIAHVLGWQNAGEANSRVRRGAAGAATLHR
jgi:DNA-binding CsgD family transcriptional regulator